MQTTTDTPSHTILVVEEDDATRTFLADQLSADGYTVYETPNLGRAVSVCASEFPDAALIDVNGGSGRTFASTIRAGAEQTVDARLPMILLGSAPGELDAVRAFDAGADDYLPKPFSYPELRARLRALLSRVDMHSRPRAVTAIGELRIDLGRRQVTVRGREVTLSVKEFALLRALASDPARVFTKSELMQIVWGTRAVGTTRTLDSHACRLRAKLDARDQRLIVNVWGVGYRLTDAAVDARGSLARAS